MLHLNFLSLPVEIICYVLDYLEMSDLLRCTTVGPIRSWFSSPN